MSKGGRAVPSWNLQVRPPRLEGRRLQEHVGRRLRGCHWSKRLQQSVKCRLRGRQIPTQHSSGFNAKECPASQSGRPMHCSEGAESVQMDFCKYLQNQTLLAVGGGRRADNGGIRACVELLHRWGDGTRCKLHKYHIMTMTSLAHWRLQSAHRRAEPSLKGNQQRAMILHRRHCKEDKLRKQRGCHGQRWLDGAQLETATKTSKARRQMPPRACLKKAQKLSLVGKAAACRHV